MILTGDQTEEGTVLDVEMENGETSSNDDEQHTLEGDDD